MITFKYKQKQNKTKIIEGKLLFKNTNRADFYRTILIFKTNIQVIKMNKIFRKDFLHQYSKNQNNQMYYNLQHLPKEILMIF